LIKVVNLKHDHFERSGFFYVQEVLVPGSPEINVWLWPNKLPQGSFPSQKKIIKKIK